jgi:hypothetical protein
MGDGCGGCGIGTIGTIGAGVGCAYIGAGELAGTVQAETHTMSIKVKDKTILMNILTKFNDQQTL